MGGAGAIAYIRAMRGKGLSPAIKGLVEFLDASSQPDEGAR
jgi:hypothetical protein